MPTRRFWGWGFEEEGPDPKALKMALMGLPALLGSDEISERARPRIEEIELRAPRVAAPSTLAPLLSESPFERALHSYGRSYRDLIRALARDFSNPPDWVAFPEKEADVVTLLDWCASERIAAIPFGGGSSVCGGVEPLVGGDFRGTLSIDLTRLDRVLEVDATSRAARIQAGALGPVLEEQLRAHDLTLRHFPQSFEFSSLGGWIATRSGGHFATGPTHIDELVESLRVVTPSGTLETRRLPGDGAGPAADRLFIGSEGAFGVITEAWMRVIPRPSFRAKASVRFDDFSTGARALRALSQSGLMPANCRLVDPIEAMLNGAGTGADALLMLAFESSDHELGPWLTRGAELCRDHGGRVREEPASEWRTAFLRAPYLRDELVARGLFVETYETAITWDRFDALHRSVTDAAQEAATAFGGNAIVTCRVTHAYPDGAAPYFTVLCKARSGAELEQWQSIKTAITDAMLAAGGTTTHHHAVGRDFRPWYLKQMPREALAALAAVKRELDPAGVLNPGALL